MFCKLYRLETFGMKNISDLISIDFCPLTVDKKSKKKISKVKSIYGANGVGKSAIINSISLFKKLALDSTLLKQKDEITKLNNIINKLKKEFYISIIFGIKINEEEKENIYKHDLIIKLDNDVPYIDSESLYILKDQTINGKFHQIFSISNGELNINNKSNLSMNKYIKNRTLNILKYSTLTSILKESDVIKETISFLNEKNDEEKDLGVINYLLIDRLFFTNISIYLESMDIHTENDNENINDLINIEFKLNNTSTFRNTIDSKRDVVKKSKINEYKNNIEKLTEFLKLFKPELKEIVLDITEDETNYYCQKKLLYNGYFVDSDFESSGIQKLMNIFNSLMDVTKGKIVFIDELDANISGVYLKTLIEYLNNINMGQLCFTTHNYYPMTCLYEYVNSIDFLGETGKLVSWKKNGNYKPYIQYPEGMIVDSPFNIDSIDYYKVFGD